jgi:2Fe-2S ferredoxin
MNQDNENKSEDQAQGHGQNQVQEQKKYKITLLPTNQVLWVTGEYNLLKTLTDNGVDILSSCGGVATCRLCKIKFTEGAKFLSPMGKKEESLMGNVFFITKERLSCQVKISGDVVIDLTEQINEQNKKK